MTIEYLKLEGEVTANLADTANFSIDNNSYTLGVAEPRPGEIGGVGPIQEVAGEVAVNVRSSPATLAGTLANVQALARLKAQVKRSRKSPAVAPVLARLRMNGSAVGELSSVVTDMDVLPGSGWSDYLMVQEVTAVRVPHQRRGLWLATTQDSNQTAAAANPTVALLTWAADRPVPSPARIRVGGFDPVNAPNTEIPAGVIIAARGPAANAGSISIVEGENVTGLTSAAEAGRNARGGAVGRLTTATGATLSNAIATGGFGTVAQYTLYAVLRKQTASTIWQLQFQIRQGVGTVRADAPVLIDGTSVDPRIVRLGSIPNADLRANSWEVVITNLSGVSSVLDIDYFVLVYHLDEFVYEVATRATSINGFAFGSTGAVLEIDPAPLGRRPTVRALNLGAGLGEFQAAGYDGDVAIHSLAGQTRCLSVVGLFTNQTNYRAMTGASPANLWVQATRWPAYWTPE